MRMFFLNRYTIFAIIKFYKGHINHNDEILTFFTYYNQ